MKTILRILVILLVAALVAGGFTLAVGNTSSTTSGFDGGQPPAMTGANGQTLQQSVGRPEGGFDGDRDGGASIGGLFGVFGTLAKLAGITVLVLLVEKGIGLLTSKKALRTA